MKKKQSVVGNVIITLGQIDSHRLRLAFRSVFTTDYRRIGGVGGDPYHWGSYTVFTAYITSVLSQIIAFIRRGNCPQSNTRFILTLSMLSVLTRILA